jgi:hypothetical protein
MRLSAAQANLCHLSRKAAGTHVVAEEPLAPGDGRLTALRKAQEPRAARAGVRHGLQLHQAPEWASLEHCAHGNPRCLEARPEPIQDQPA